MKLEGKRIIVLFLCFSFFLSCTQVWGRHHTPNPNIQESKAKPEFGAFPILSQYPGKQSHTQIGGISLLSNAGEFKEITQRGYLIVAIKDNLRPLGFRSATGK